MRMKKKTRNKFNKTEPKLVSLKFHIITWNEKHTFMPVKKQLNLSLSKLTNVDPLKI